jgi:hypothetical protein
MIVEFPLQILVAKFGCRYFAENDTGDGEIINLALRSPFIRLYALNRSPEILDSQKRRFQDNERVQLFQKTHDSAWLELVRLVPSEQPAVFWIHATENVGRCLTIMARLRFRRADVIMFELGQYRGVIRMAERYFRQTHWLAHFPDPFGGIEIIREWGHGPTNPSVFILHPRGIVNR